MPLFAIKEIKPYPERYDGTSFPAKVTVVIRNQVIEDVAVYKLEPNKIRQVQYNELEAYLNSISNVYRNTLDQEIIKACRTKI